MRRGLSSYEVSIKGKRLSADLIIAAREGVEDLGKKIKIKAIQP